MVRSCLAQPKACDQTPQAPRTCGFSYSSSATISRPPLLGFAPQLPRRGSCGGSSVGGGGNRKYLTPGSSSNAVTSGSETKLRNSPVAAEDADHGCAHGFHPVKRDHAPDVAAIASYTAIDGGLIAPPRGARSSSQVGGIKRRSPCSRDEPRSPPPPHSPSRQVRRSLVRSCRLDEFILHSSGSSHALHGGRPRAPSIGRAGHRGAARRRRVCGHAVRTLQGTRHQHHLDAHRHR